MHKSKTIQDKEIEYKAIYRSVKHPRLEFKTGDLILILPENWKDDAETLIKKHETWIYKKNSLIVDALSKGKKKKLNQKRSEEALKKYVREQALIYFKELKLTEKTLRFREMKSKWASCSLKIITINTFLKYLPDQLINYVIYHEIVHLRERKHNARFWKLIEKKFKSVKSKEKDLMMYWFLIQRIG